MKSQPGWRASLSALTPASLLRQLVSFGVAVPLTFIVTLVVLLLIGVQAQVPVTVLVRDPAQLAKYPFYTGLVSYIGILGWCFCATACFLSSAVLGHRRGQPPFLLAGILTTVLGLDDLFILHEEAFPLYLGISERVVLLVYAVLMLAVLLALVRTVLRTDFLLLAFAFIFLGSSVVLDLGPFGQGLNYLLDDGLKLIGIMGWTAYWTRTGVQYVRQAIEDPLASGAPSLPDRVASGATVAPGQDDPGPVGAA
jgi:hypothetical protein